MIWSIAIKPDFRISRLRMHGTMSRKWKRNFISRRFKNNATRKKHFAVLLLNKASASVQGRWRTRQQQIANAIGKMNAHKFYCGFAIASMLGFRTAEPFPKQRNFFRANGTGEISNVPRIGRCV
jgi:hypothetical protein